MPRHKAKCKCCKACCLPFPTNGKKRLYLDFAVTGGPCGQLSFTGMPIGGTYAGAVDGPNSLNCGNSGSQEYIGVGHNPYPIDADCWINSPCDTALANAGCGGPIGCKWNLDWQIACETSGNPALPNTGRYALNFGYFFTNSCRFSFIGVVKPIRVLKCWKHHRKVDMTFKVRLYTPDFNACPAVCMAVVPLTVTFRIYT